MTDSILSTTKCLGSKAILSPENNKADFWGEKGWAILVHYLMKCVLKQKCQKFHHRELGVGLNSS